MYLGWFKRSGHLHTGKHHLLLVRLRQDLWHFELLRLRLESKRSDFQELFLNLWGLYIFTINISKGPNGFFVAGIYHPNFCSQTRNSRRWLSINNRLYDFYHVCCLFLSKLFYIFISLGFESS